jgi:hypothetical protein
VAYFAPTGYFVNQFSSAPQFFITRELRLFGDEYTGESITNLNKSANIRKNSKSLIRMSNDEEMFAEKKIRVKNLVTPSFKSISAVKVAMPTSAIFLFESPWEASHLVLFLPGARWAGLLLPHANCLKMWTIIR